MSAKKKATKKASKCKHVWYNGDPFYDKDGFVVRYEKCAKCGELSKETKKA